MKIITRARCQQICSEWHGGQWSALYQFASSGVYMPENHLHYLRELQGNREPEYWLHPGTISKKHDSELKSAQRYFIECARTYGIDTEWLKHDIYGYLMPTTTDSRCKAVNYPA